MTTEHVVKELQRNRLLSDREEVIAFETALELIAAAADVTAHLVELHLVFDDSTKHEDVMYGLVHLLESLDVEEQLCAFLHAAQKMSTTANEWVRTLLYRALGDEPARSKLGSLLDQMTGNGPAHVRRVLEDMATNESEPVRVYALEALGKNR